MALALPTANFTFCPACSDEFYEITATLDTETTSVEVFLLQGNVDIGGAYTGPPTFLSRAPRVGALSFRVFASNVRRLSLRGSVVNEYRNGTLPEVRVSTALQYSPLHGSTTSCSATATTTADSTGSYAIIASSAPPIQWLDAVTLAPAGSGTGTLRGRAYAVQSQYSYLFSQTSFEGALVVSVHVGADAAWNAVAVQTTTTGVGGSFSFTGLQPGMYTVKSRMNSAVSSLFSPLVIVDHSINVGHNEQAAPLGVLVVNSAAPIDETFVVLRYETLYPTALSLVVSFTSDSSSYEQSSRCEVWEGRPYCGRAVWTEASLPCTAAAAAVCGNPFLKCFFDASCSSNPAQVGCFAGGQQTCRFCGSLPYTACPSDSVAAVREVAQVVTMSALAPSAYNIFVNAPRRLCLGFGLAAPPLYAGGPDGTVDCIGNCKTGTGYCYATLDNKSQSCLLYAPGGYVPFGQRLCSDYGEAQATFVRYCTSQLLGYDICRSDLDAQFGPLASPQAGCVPGCTATTEMLAV
ncbi:hypothetical protein AB1Y20_011726 [Prymnesium parvum]|uniref:Uncharacterized protein n=1 Tax=Prymnesium parvum TaxID=97485 RepID=A0AB34II91_PRYPA